jgi:hypothetical protein
VRDNPSGAPLFGLVAVALLQHLGNRGAFDHPEIGRVVRGDCAECSVQMFGVDERAFAENRGALQDVAKLSNVARPLVLKQALACLASQTSGRPAEAICRSPSENVSLSGTMSDGRSRNGGIWMSNTPRR